MAFKVDTSRMYEKAEELFGIDLRSLALFRISLGVLILWDLSIRATALTAHYTDAGVLPRAVLYEEYPRQLYLSLHTLSGDLLFQAFLFLLAGVAACALVIGFYTRAAAVLSWGLMLSLHVRNPAVLNSGDTIFLLLLFWGMLLPLGARFSVDEARKRDSEALPRKVLSAATLGLLLQICFIYWFSVIWKSSPEWHAEGTAVYYALSLDRFATSFGQWLLSAPPEFLRALTRSTLWFELLGPMLAFIPIFNGPIRTAAVGAFAAFHVGLALAMTLGLFPAVCIAAWLVFLPSWFWDVALPKLRSLPILRFVSLKEQSASPKPAMQSSLAVNAVAALAVWYVFTYNIYNLDYRITLDQRTGHYLPSGSGSAIDGYFQCLTPVGQALNLNQTWRMFSPRPSTADGWYVVAGKLKNGEQVDVFKNGALLSWDRPRRISATYKNQRWRKYAGERLLEKQEALGPLFAHYLRNDWNRRHPEEQQLEEVEVYLMYEENLLDRKATPVEKRLIAHVGKAASPPGPNLTRTSE